MRYMMMSGILVLTVVLAALCGLAPQSKKIKVENESNPGKEVLRLDVVEAVNYEIDGTKTLVVCFRVMPTVGAKQGVSGRLKVEYDGQEMRFDGGATQRSVRFKPGGENLVIARIEVDRTRGAGELQWLKASVSSVSFFDA